MKKIFIILAIVGMGIAGSVHAGFFDNLFAKYYYYPTSNPQDLTLGSQPAFTVSQGGTGTSTFPLQGFLFAKGTTTFSASSSPTFPYFTATSTSASSTAVGGLEVGLLKVKSTTGTSTFANGIILVNGCVQLGIGGPCSGAGGMNQTPWLSNVDANGYSLSNLLNLSGTSTITISAAGVLINNASSTITNLVTVNATTTSATTTNLYVSGSLLNSGATSTIFNLTTLNATTTNSYATGNSIFNQASTTILNLRSLTIQGGAVSGISLISSGGIFASGTSEFDGNTVHLGSVKITGGVYASGTAEIDGLLTTGAISGTTITGSTLKSTGGLFASGTAEIDGLLTAGTISGGSITGTVLKSSGGIFASGTSEFDGNVLALGSVKVTGGVYASGTAEFDGRLTAGTISATTLLNSSGIFASGTAEIDGKLTAGTVSVTSLIDSGGLFATGTSAFSGLSSFYGGILVNNSTSTITNLVTVNATSTNATTTALYVSGNLGVATTGVSSAFAVQGNESISGTTTAGGLWATSTLRVGLLTSCDTVDTDSVGQFKCGTDAGSQTPWTSNIDANGYSISNLLNISGTSTITISASGVVINNASSTITNLITVNTTSTNATTSQQYISGGLQFLGSTDASTMDITVASTTPLNSNQLLIGTKNKLANTGEASATTTIRSGNGGTGNPGGSASSLILRGGAGGQGVGLSSNGGTGATTTLQAGNGGSRGGTSGTSGTGGGVEIRAGDGGTGGNGTNGVGGIGGDIIVTAGAASNANTGVRGGNIIFNTGTGSGSSNGNAGPAGNFIVNLGSTGNTGNPATNDGIFILQSGVHGTTTIFRIQDTLGTSWVTFGTTSGLSLINTPLVVNNSTSTITNLITVNATSTNAYISGAFVANGASSTITNLNATGINTVSLTASGGIFATGSVAISGLTTHTGSLIVNNSTSTITNLVTVNATSTNATTTGGVNFTGLAEVTAANANVCITSTGRITKDSTLACLTSNPKFKNNIEPLKGLGLSTILALQPIEFDWKPNQARTGHDIGFNAEQAGKVDERLVAMQDGVAMGFRYQEFGAALTKAIQELYGMFVNLVIKVTGLENRINTLEQKNVELEARLSKLEKK